MTLKVRTIFGALAALSIMFCGVGALAQTELTTTPEKVIREYEKRTQGERASGLGGTVIQVRDGTLSSSFGPAYGWFLLRYRQYPVPIQILPPMSSNNFFIVDRTSKIHYVIASDEQAKMWFKSRLVPVATDAQAQQAMMAWFKVAQELHQDGMVTYSAPSGTIVRKGVNLIAVGKVPSNCGDLTVSLQFDNAGKLARIESGSSIAARR